MKQKKNGFAKVIILVVSLIVIGISGTYAYFTLSMSEPQTTSAKAGVFKVESSLETTNAINNNKIRLIDNIEKETKAEKVTFTVTSKAESTVDGEYYIYLKDILLSKNLYTKYLHWELVQNNVVKASGDFADIASKRTDTPVAGEADNVVTNISEIKLNETPFHLDKNSQDTLIFRMWLENDPNVNQIAITNGSFAGRLYLEAFPISEINGTVNQNQ